MKEVRRNDVRSVVYGIYLTCEIKVKAKRKFKRGPQIWKIRSQMTAWLWA